MARSVDNALQGQVVELDITLYVGIDQLHDIGGRARSGLFSAAAFTDQQKGDNGDDRNDSHATAQVEDQLRVRGLVRLSLK
ncbi:hypothetical protein D3C76_1675310 [compost metagenome]